MNITTPKTAPILSSLALAALLLPAGPVSAIMHDWLPDTSADVGVEGVLKQSRPMVLLQSEQLEGHGAPVSVQAELFIQDLEQGSQLDAGSYTGTI